MYNVIKVSCDKKNRVKQNHIKNSISNKSVTFIMKY